VTILTWLPVDQPAVQTSAQRTLVDLNRQHTTAQSADLSQSTNS